MNACDSLSLQFEVAGFSRMGGTLAEQWIEKLIQELKSKGHNAAEEYNAAKHRRAVVAEKGPIFFNDLAKAITRDVEEVVQGLKDSPLSQATDVRVGPTEAVIIREAVPKINTTITLETERITFRYLAGDRGWKVEQYSFQVGEHDGISVQEQFGAEAKHFNSPDALAKHIVTTVFTEFDTHAV